MNLFFTTVFAAFMAANAQNTETYLYTIYYEESDCQNSAVALSGKVSTNEQHSVGGWDNVTEQCSVESTCNINNSTDICKNQLIFTGASDVRADIDDQGDVFECDTSNDVVDQALCRVVEGCKSSSKLPHCNFQLATTSDLFENPDLIRYENAFDNDGLDLQSYMLLYSNDDCSEFEGARGIVTGNTSILATPETMPCEEAVACAFVPYGENCVNSGGVTGEIVSFITKPAATEAIVCADGTDESCTTVDPGTCMKSEAYPSCWYRLPTAKAFFSDPEEYLVGTKFVYENEQDPVVVDDTQEVVGDDTTAEEDDDSDAGVAVTAILSGVLSLAAALFA